MTVNRDWKDLGNDVQCTNLYVSGQLLANGGAAPTTPVTPPFLYTASGTENPAGFAVAFPSGARPAPGTNYVALVGLAGVANLVVVDVPSASYAADHIVVKASGQLSIGDVLAVVIEDTAAPAIVAFALFRP